MKKNILTTGGIILALLLGVFGIVNDDKIIIQDGKPVNVGSLSGPDITYPYLAVNGVKKEFRSAYMSGATTTPCSIQSPAATSSLERYSYSITTGTSTAAILDVGTSTTAFGTSTLNFIHQRSIASGAQDTAFYNATTSATGGASVNGVLAPNTWVNLKTGAGLSGYTFGGVCTAIFDVN